MDTAILNEISARSRRLLGVYVLVTAVALVFGVSGGAMGLVFALPLLLPWSVVFPVVDRVLGLGILAIPGMGILFLFIEAAVNTLLLFFALRAFDRRSQRLRDRQP